MGIKEYVFQSPVPVGLIKVPLLSVLPLWISQKIGRLVLWKNISIFLLQFAETQAFRWLYGKRMIVFLNQIIKICQNYNSIIFSKCLSSMDTSPVTVFRAIIIFLSSDLSFFWFIHTESSVCQYSRFSIFPFTFHSTHNRIYFLGFSINNRQPFYFISFICV